MHLFQSNLLVRFSVVSFVMMTAIAVVLAVVLSNKIRDDAVEDLVDEAVGTSTGRLLARITPQDLETPMVGQRYDDFHRFVQQSIVSARTARIKLWSKDGTVIYSNDPAGVGERLPEKDNLLIALTGENAIEIKMPNDAENRREVELGSLMEVYTPIVFDGSPEPQGAFEIYQYYWPTAERINDLRAWVFLLIGAGFSALYAALVYIVWGGWRTIKNQQIQLESFNGNLAQEVEDRTADLESFSYSLSHDIRAPLRSINGFGQALYEDYADQMDDQGEDYLERMRTSTQNMEQLIDGLLELSRLSRSELETCDINLSEVARSIAADLQDGEPEWEVSFSIQDHLVANGDPRLLRVALENLLGNAWKYTSKRPEARIEFGSSTHMGSLTGNKAYFVRDDGAGFDMAYAGKLFGPFQRLHKVSEFAGTGIGLATVHRIVERHGGKIWAEGEVDNGAAFYFTLDPKLPNRNADRSRPVGHLE